MSVWEWIVIGSFSLMFGSFTLAVVRIATAIDTMALALATLIVGDPVEASRCPEHGDELVLWSPGPGRSEILVCPRGHMVDDGGS